MNFAFDEEQELLRRTARSFLAEQAPMARVREVMDGAGGELPGLWKQMAELGWLGLAIPEDEGGSGLSLVELALVAEELGRSLAPVPFLPTAIAARAVLQVGTPQQRALWLPGICRGDTRASFAFEEAGASAELADVGLRAEPSPGGFRLQGSKLFVPHAADAGLVVVVARTGDAPDRDVALLAVPGDAPGLERTPQRAFEPLRPLHRLDFDGVQLPREALLGGRPDAGEAVRRAIDAALVMICAEMLGGAERCLEDAVAYAKQREQFGRPIGAYQAIQHKCADMLFAVESSRSITYYAAWAADARPDAAPLAAAMAKAYVGDAFRDASAENIQIHGGVGFTWEYDCHLFFKRARADGCWLGDAAHHRERVARLLPL